MLVIGNDVNEVGVLKGKLGNEFAMKDLGSANQEMQTLDVTSKVFGEGAWMVQYEQVQTGFYFAWKSFEVDTWWLSEGWKEKWRNEKGAPYACMVCSLMYAMMCTRPDMAHVVGVVSRLLSNPDKAHWIAMKWILRYIHSTTGYCLC